MSDLFFGGNSLGSNSLGPEDVVETAVAAVAAQADLRTALDCIPAAVYVTDSEGRITYYNGACIAFAGRTPVINEDRWCVTWKLHDIEGHSLRHEECPMAVAIKQKRRIRGVEAIAERPDGSRIRFVPYPTPVIGEDGELIGAVNLLVDVTERRQAPYLRAQAARCRRLAASMGDERTSATLRSMAAEYDEQAGRIERPN